MLELRRRCSGSAGGGQPSRLPAGYQEVEYLENSENPNAYLVIPEIVRGYSGSIIADISISSISTQQPAGRYKMAFGWSQGPQVVLDTMKWQNYYVGTYLADVGVKYKVQLDINDNISELFVDGNLIARNTTFDNDRGLHILNSHASNLGLFGRIYNLKSDGTVTIDLIPCYRISDRVAGMYDIVNDVFYTNEGTGEFLVGADVHYNIPP